MAVLAVEDSHRIVAVKSGNDGRFAIGGLAAAKYQLTASKRGYSTAAYDEHGAFSSAVVTGEGQDTGNLVFRLTPSAVLRGVVTADGGDPVEGARVMLFQKPTGHEPGARDHTGRHIHHRRHRRLRVRQPGQRGISAGGGGGALVCPAPQRLAAGRGESCARRGLSVTYYDSTTDEASASPIVLTGGSRVEANVGLHAVTALHLLIEAPLKPDGSAVVPELKQFVFGTQISSHNADFMDAITNGHADFSGIAPSQYELTQGDPPRVLVLDANSSQQVEPGAGIPAFP